MDDEPDETDLVDDGFFESLMKKQTVQKTIESPR
jgi:hypothetical protein